MRLVRPSIKYKASYLEALGEFRAENSKEGEGFAIDGSNFDEMMKKYEDYSRGKNLPDNYVPASEFWLVDNNRFIGRLSVRHKINKLLKGRGGHIGYAIRPSERKKGYGTKVLELGLLEAKNLGLDKVLVTCRKNNDGSRKIIEKNGGKLIDEAVRDDGEIGLRFWIDL